MRRTAGSLVVATWVGLASPVGAQTSGGGGWTTPSEDTTSDNVRIVSWERPLPIALSRKARALIPLARSRPLPPALAAEVFSERTNALVALVGSPRFRALIHARDGADELRLVHAEPTYRAVTFQQYFFDDRDGTWAQVSGARVAIHLTSDGLGIQGITSFFQPDLGPPAAEIGAQDAHRTALAAAREWGAADPIVELEPDPIVVRRPAPLGGARPASEVRRGGDRKFFHARVGDRRVELAPVTQVLVDAETGGIGHVRVLSSGAAALPNYHSSQLANFVPLLLPDTAAVINQLLCTFFDGQGLDLDGKLRTFSTTWYPAHQVQDNPSQPYAMVSCDEIAPGRSFIDPLDIITFASDPQLDTALVNARVFRDNDNDWTEPSSHPKRHAVAAQFWGERVLGFFRTRGYWNRDHLVEFEPNKPAVAVPARVMTWYGAPATKFTEVSMYWLKDNPTTHELLKGNALIALGPPEGPFRTSVDLSSLGHEFAHSFTWDVAYSPGETGQSQPLAGLNTESFSIDEGIADCLSMLMLADNMADLGPRYGLTGNDAPFHLGADLYTNPDLGFKGNPNLDNPWDSDPGRYTYWSGQRKNFETETDADVNSTLVSGPCKLLITGGTQPQLSNTRTNVPQSAVALHEDRLVSYKRLSDLLFYTWLETKAAPTYGSYHDLIDILAANEKHLGAGESGAERVRRAFAQYGFGRGTEFEPNSVPQINTNAQSRSRNLLSVGKRHRRAIVGEVCDNGNDKDEDVFLLNERVAPGDFISFPLIDTAAFDVRFWRENACGFDDKYCTYQRQVFPEPVVDVVPGTATSPDSVDTSFTFPKGPGGAVNPGGNKWRPVYVGVRRKSGPCNQTYALDVEIQRGPGNEVYP